MTVSFNLSQLANSVNSSGLLSLATGVTSTLPVANGGTGDTTAAGARTNLVAAGSGAVGSSGITMTTARLLGRTTASTGAIEEITVGSGLTLSAGTLVSTTTVDTTAVLTALAGLTAGAVGTVAFLQNRGATNYSFGDTGAGTDLYPASNNQSAYQNSARSGTWRCLGYCPTTDEGTYYSTLFIRIS
jgi:hypothetical protein